MNNMRSVIQHLIVDHRLPYFCPMLPGSFVKATDRDIHIVARRCRSRGDVVLPNGISEDKVKQLDCAYRQWPASSVSEEEQWQGVLGLLSSGASRVHSPYLSEPRERGLVLLRQFSCDEGNWLISSELER